MSPSNSPRTFGDLYTEITSKSILTPEEEVELKKRVFEKYGGYAGLLKKRKETITDRTHEELDELLTDLPNKSTILAKLEQYLPSMPKVPKMDPKTPEAIRVAGAEAVRDGIDKAKEVLSPLTAGGELSPEKIGKRLLEGVEETAAVLSVAGAAVMAAPTIEAKAKALDGLGGVIGSGWDKVGDFFTKIFDAIGLLFSGKFSDALSKLKESVGIKQEDSPQKTRDEKKDGPKIQPKLSPEEQKEILRTKSWETFFRKYGAWIKDGNKASAEKQFKSLWDKYASGMKEIPEDIANKITSGEIINPITSGEQALKTNGKFIIDLINTGVLPIEALKSQMMFGIEAGVQIGIGTVRSLVDSSTRQVDGMIGYLSGEDISQLPEDKRKVLFAHFYHNLAFATWFMGRSAGLLMKTAMLPVSWENATGWNQAKAGYHTLMGDLDKTAIEIEKITNTMGADKAQVAEQIDGARKAMGSIAREQITQLAIREAFVMNKGSYPEVRKSLEMLSKDSKLDLSIIQEFLNITDPGTPSGYRQEVANKIGNLHRGTGNLNIPESLWLKVKEGFGGLQWQNAAHELRGATMNMNKALAFEILHFDTPVFAEYAKVRSAAATTKYAHYLDRGILPIVVNDLGEAKSTLQRLQYTKLPGAIAGAADSLSFLVITKHAFESEDKIKTFYDDIININPAYAGVMLVKEGFDIETSNGAFRMDKLGYIAAGGTLLTLSGFMLYQIFSAPTAAARMIALANFAASPIVSAGKFGMGSIATMRLSAEYLRHLGSPTGAQAARQLATTLKGGGRTAIAGLILSAGIGGYIWYQNKRDEEIHAELKNRKIIREDGSYDNAMIRQEFANLASDMKVRLYEQFTHAILGDVPHRTRYNAGNKALTVELTEPKGQKGVGLDQIESLKSLGELTGEKSIITFTKSAKEQITKNLASLPASEGVIRELGKQFGIS